MKSTSIIRSIALLGLLFAIQEASAAQVNWGTSRLADNLTSDLKPLGSDSAFHFEVGSFAEGFTPTPENAAEWAAQWIPAGSAEYRTDFRFAAGSALAGSAIPAGSRGYIWGFDSRQADAVEWILVSDSAWIWQSDSAMAPPQDWTAARADEVIVGAVGGDLDAFHLQTSALQLGSSPQMDPEAWRGEHFAGELESEIAAWDADADADGIANALEFVFGTSPRNADQATRASVGSLREAGATYLTIRFDAAPVSAAALVVEVSDDLESWNPAGTSVQVTTGEDFFELRDTLPATSGRRFFRLRADL